MDLSKAFDRMPHGLLIAKLHAYGLSDDACNMVISYLKDRRQRVRVMGEFSDCGTINRGVPQGYVMGPFLFNIFLNDLFYVDMNCELLIIYIMLIIARILWKMFMKMTPEQPLLGLKIITWMPTLINSKA